MRLKEGKQYLRRLLVALAVSIPNVVSAQIPCTSSCGWGPANDGVVFGLAQNSPTTALVCITDAAIAQPLSWGVRAYYAPGNCQAVGTRANQAGCWVDDRVCGLFLTNGPRAPTLSYTLQWNESGVVPWQHVGSEETTILSGGHLRNVTVCITSGVTPVNIAVYTASGQGSTQPFQSGCTTISNVLTLILNGGPPASGTLQIR